MSADFELTGDEVHLWIGSLISSRDLLERSNSVLSAEEHERAGRFLREVDRERFAIGRLKLREVLSRYTGIPAADLVFRTNPFGKPELAAGMNPGGIDFNLSHSDERMIVGIARGARIGVDIERIRPELAPLDVAARFFTERENDELKSLRGESQVLGFFQCWTRKEAYLKALGCGLSIEPKEIEVTLKPDEPAKIVRPATGEGDGWHLFHFAEDGYVGAVAVDKPVRMRFQRADAPKS